MAVTPASVSALLKPKANIGRNAFPLDHRQVYSIKAGQITPVKCMKFVPNDHFEIEVGEFCITFPMQTAPFLRGRKETVFYSVYNSAVWSLFNQYIGQRNDPKTSALNDNLKEPRIALWELYKVCISQLVYYLNYKVCIPAYVYKTYSDQPETIQQRQINSLRDNYLSTPIDAGNFEAWAPYGNAALKVDTTTLSNVGWSLYYTNASINPNADLVYYRDFCQDVVGQWRVFNYLRKLDMLGYGNLVPWFKEVVDTMEDWLESVEDWTAEGAYTNFVSDCNNLITALVNKILLCCFTSTKYDMYGNIASDGVLTPVYKNLYAICAYNLVFYHFFRNSFYDLNYPSENYNLDFISTRGRVGNDYNVVGITEFSCRFLDIEYHQWKKDQFTGVLQDTQFGAVSSLELSSSTTSDLGRWLKSGSGSFSSGSSVVTSATGNLRLSDPATNIYHSHDVSVSFDMIALKRAELLQDYRQTLMRAGNKTSDIFTALYGGSPSSEHLDDIIPRFLETFGEDVFVDPVTATANTEQGNNGTLGDLSARGKFSGKSKKFSFNAGYNFGVVLCLTYFVPSAEYNSYFIDPQNNCLNPEDHYISNFENMGLEPIYSDELNSLRNRRYLSVLGYAPRYHYLKSQVDVVHGEFVSLPENQKIMSYMGGAVFSRGRKASLGYQGAFNIWVSPRTDMQNRDHTQLRDFYINPSILDNIFVQSADAMQSSDTLICNTYLNWQATRGMSKVGLMNFV